MKRTTIVKCALPILMILMLLGAQTAQGANAGTIKDVDISQTLSTKLKVEVTYNVNFTGTIFINVRVLDAGVELAEEQDDFTVATADVNTDDTVSITFAAQPKGTVLTVKVKIGYETANIETNLDSETETFTTTIGSTNFWANVWLLAFIGLAGLGLVAIIAFVALKKQMIPGLKKE